ncbi:MAG: 30S ribosomal protein S12 methylthiotransferase RimO, partial [Candidatus Dadabacteria bacterium]
MSRLLVLNNTYTPPNNKSPLKSSFALKPSAIRGRASVITLGCAKNQVDSELFAGILQRNGYFLTGDLREADLVIINTCGFLKAALDEGIEVIKNVLHLKKLGAVKRVIVAGCMVNREKKELSQIFPEVDYFLRTDELALAESFLNNTIEDTLKEGLRPYLVQSELLPRIVDGRQGYAYLKIAEGCNRPCSFCVIPKIRGKFSSRSVNSLLQEAEELVQGGIKELVLIAQDLTAYGSDRKESSEDLIKLLDQLSTTGVQWIRLLYTYPLGISDELLRYIEESPVVCKYLDIPLQHISEKVLKKMKRPLGKFAPRKLIERIKKLAPSLALRTTFIVGFPGESDKDAEELVSFVKEGHFLHLGVFTFSPEEGSEAALLPKQVSEKVKEERLSAVMLAQQEVSRRVLKTFIGKELEVLIEETGKKRAIGRSEFQAPEVDGKVIIKALNQKKALK